MKHPEHKHVVKFYYAFVDKDIISKFVAHESINFNSSLEYMILQNKNVYYSSIDNRIIKNKKFGAILSRSLTITFKSGSLKECINTVISTILIYCVVKNIVMYNIRYKVVRSDECTTQAT